MLLRLARLLTAQLVVAFALIACPSAALADSASIDFLDAAGHSDPVAGIGRTFVVNATTESEKYLYVKYRATGGAPCGPSASTDSGTYLQPWAPYATSSVNGSQRFTRNAEWTSPGTYMFCIWLADGSTASATPFTQIVTFRSASASISGIVGPFSPLTTQRATLTALGATEAPARVYAKVRAAGGAPCGPSYDADAGSSLINGVQVNGSFSTTAVVTQAKAGTYLACLWLFDDSSLLSGPQPVTFTVRAPCRIPRVTRRMRLRNARAALLRNHCAVGGVRYRYSRARARGRVIGFDYVQGKHLAPGTVSAVTVSKGKKPRRHHHRRRR